MATLDLCHKHDARRGDGAHRAHRLAVARGVWAGLRAIFSPEVVGAWLLAALVLAVVGGVGTLRDDPVQRAQAVEQAVQHAVDASQLPAPACHPGDDC